MAKEVLVEISARHVHVCKETLETLFGAGHELTNKKDLSQLMNYYNEVYTILLAQAQRQTAFKLSMDESVLYELKRRIMASISQAPISIETKEINNILEIRIKVLGKHIPDNLFTPEVGNLDAFVAQILRVKPATVKGEYIKNISISSTMGPGIKVENNFDK